MLLQNIFSAAETIDKKEMLLYFFSFYIIFLCCIFFSQMEDGHTIFDYNVGLNDIVQLLIRQKAPPGDVVKSKEKEAELSDSDSGCGSTQSESDKSSTHGEVEGQTAGTSAQTNAAELIDPGFGFYKVSFYKLIIWFT